MSDTTASLRRKIVSARDLQSVVRTMKALAASSIGQYEKSVRALGDYYRTVELGLGACFRESKPDALPGRARDMQPTTRWSEFDPGAPASLPARRVGAIAGKDASAPGGGQAVDSSVMVDRQGHADAGAMGAVVFGSDQGLVGQFNDVVADFAVQTLAALPGQPKIWAVGERVHARLTDAGLPPLGLFTVPNSVQAITPLIGQILVEHETHHDRGEVNELHLFYNRPKSGSVYAPVHQRLLPLDETWRRKLAELPWPTKPLPEVLGDSATLRALIREYLFVSLFRACAESLASENASRLAAMERADRNIDELLADLNGNFHRLRQSGIDEELFDVISGFEALAGPRQHAKRVAIHSGLESS